jgi:acyl-CoA reductase-like NAD-dependent aldehyde dehydrogenase
MYQPCKIFLTLENTWNVGERIILLFLRVLELSNKFTAANWAALGFLYNTGQDCTAGSRVYVQESVYDEFVSLLVTKAKQHIIGDAFDERVASGPVVRNEFIIYGFLH